MPSANNQLKYPPWHSVERQIQEEITWLRNSIETFSDEEKYAPIRCLECLLRKIAVLIVSGRVNATEITRGRGLQSFWSKENLITHQNKILKTKVYHGKDWHSKTMERIENHFICQGFEVIREPNLHWGRADLGIYKQGIPNLYIEVGTMSLFKLWINLREMKNFVYLIVPNDIKLIEFIGL